MSTVIEQLRVSAEAGDARAQFELAIAAEEGFHGNPDFEVAAHWYLQAAKQGHPCACINLCQMALRPEINIEVPSSVWSQTLSAAESGDRDAQLSIGLAYWDGGYVRQDYAVARHWYERAAASGSREAQFNMGGLYFEGQGVAKDLSEAVRWYSRAANQAHELAFIQLGLMYEKGLGVEKNIEEALTLYRCAYNRNSMRGAVHLGILYAKGIAVPKDSDLAYEFLTRSLDFRDSPDSPAAPSYEWSALYWLGSLCEAEPRLGDTTALEWYRRGANAGSEDCQKAMDRLHTAVRSRPRAHSRRTKG